MKAFRLSRYGHPTEVLTPEDVDTPEPKPNEIQIKVSHAAVNDYDWCLTTGNPKEYRLFFGLFKPRKKLRTPGMEVAGVIEKVGESVTRLKVGDAVYGDTSEHGFGSFAEYMCVDERAVVKKPDFLPFEDAVALPHASMLAYEGLHNEAKLQNGQKVLINGGGGGVGAIALSLAKELNCHVTGVDTGDKLDKMKVQGFDQVIDYKKVAFVEQSETYDIIFDCRTQLSPWRYLRALNDGGKYVTIGGRSGKLIQLVLLKAFIKILKGKIVHMCGVSANSRMDIIEDLYRDGKLKPIIDGPFSFEETPLAVQRFGDARHHGKVVISVS